MPTDPTIVAALVAALTALITGGISAWVAVYLQRGRLREEFRLQEDRLRTELKLEFAAEAAIRELLSEEKWKKRSFKQIKKRLQGFEDAELKKLLIRSGAVSFRRPIDGEELWGLRERNRKELDDED